MRSNSIDPFDLMSKNNLKPPAHGRYILSAQDGTYHKLEELNDLELKSFPTVLLFPEGRGGFVKLGSERRDPDSLNIFVESIVGKL